MTPSRVTAKGLVRRETFGFRRGALEMRRKGREARVRVGVMARIFRRRANPSARGSNPPRDRVIGLAKKGKAIHEEGSSMFPWPSVPAFSLCNFLKVEAERRTGIFTQGDRAS